MDRSKFKDTTKVSDLKKRDKELEEITHQKDDSYASFLSIDDGENKFRIYPPHPNEEENSFFEPLQKWWLPINVKDESGKIKKVRKPVFDARIHSEAGVCVVDEYIKFLKKMLEENGCSENEVIEMMIPIYGKFSKDRSKNEQGIIGRTTWIMYAEKITGNKREFGRLEVGKAIKQRINELIAVEDSSEVIGTEYTNPFTDLDDGRLMIITKNSNAERPQDWYKTEIDTSFDKTTKMVKLHPLSDEDLEKFINYPSLASLYKQSYSKADFQIALEGLKNLDDENKFGVFQYEEFINICEYLKELYPEKEIKEEQSKSIETETTSVSEPEKPTRTTQDTNQLSDEFDDMNREELQNFFKVNKTGIFVRQTFSDDDLRKMAREWVLGEQTLPFDKPGNDLVEEKQQARGGVVVGVKTPAVLSGDVADKLAALREKIKK